MVDWNRSCWVQSESLGLSFFLSWCIDLWLIRINRINVKAPFVPCLPTAVPLIGKFDLTFTSFLILMEHFSTGYCSSYLTVAAVLVNIYRIMCVCVLFSSPCWHSSHCPLPKEKKFLCKTICSLSTTKVALSNSCTTHLHCFIQKLIWLPTVT